MSCHLCKSAVLEIPLLTTKPTPFELVLVILAAGVLPPCATVNFADPSSTPIPRLPPLIKELPADLIFTVSELSLFLNLNTASPFSNSIVARPLLTFDSALKACPLFVALITPLTSSVLSGTNAGNPIPTLLPSPLVKIILSCMPVPAAFHLVKVLSVPVPVTVPLLIACI